MVTPAWELYGGVAVVLALVVVGLARLSEGLLRERFDHSADAGSGAVPDATSDATSTDVLDPDSSGVADADDTGAVVADADDTDKSAVPGAAASGDRVPPAVETRDARRDSSANRPRIPPESPGFTPSELLLNVLLSHGLLGVLLAAAAWYAAIPLDTLGATAAAVSAPLVAVGAGLGVAFYLVDEGLAALADQFGVGYSEALRSAMAPESRVGWIVLLGAVLPITAAFEELLFRATLVGALAAGTGASPWLLAVGSSVLFGLAHGVQGRLGVLVTGALGFGLAAAFVLTESLLCVIVAHYLVNALEFVVHEGLGLGD